MKQRLTRLGSLLCPLDLGTPSIGAKPRPKESLQRSKEIEKARSSNRGSGGNNGRTRKPHVFALDSIRELLFIFFAISPVPQIMISTYLFLPQICFGSRKDYSSCSRLYEWSRLACQFRFRIWSKIYMGKGK